MWGTETLQECKSNTKEKFRIFTGETSWIYINYKLQRAFKNFTWQLFMVLDKKYI